MCDSWFPRSLYFVFWGLMPQVLRIWNLYTAFYCWALQWQFQVFHMRNTHFWSLFCIVCIVCNKFKPKWRLSNTSVMVQIDYFKVKYKNGKNTFKNIKIMMHYLSLYLHLTDIVFQGSKDGYWIHLWESNSAIFIVPVFPIKRINSFKKKISPLNWSKVFAWRVDPHWERK